MQRVRFKKADREKVGQRFVALMQELGLGLAPFQIWEAEYFKAGLMHRDDEVRSQRYRADTLYGPLDVTLDVCQNMVSVYMRFEDPDRAWAGLTGGAPRLWGSDLNPHSGKWNIHTEDANVALEEVRLRLVERCGVRGVAQAA